MPYAGGLYSMTGESDGDGYADQLSPSDGYFAAPSSSSHAVPNVPNILVPDPTLQQRSESGAESKALEAEEEKEPSNARTAEYYHHNYNHAAAGSGLTGQPGRLEHYAASSSTAPRQHRCHSTFTHTYSHSSLPYTPFRNYPTRGQTSVYSDAPPAYSPSPIYPIPPTNQQPQSRGYSTFTPTMGAPNAVENARLLGRSPESIGQPIAEESGNTMHWTRRVRRRLPTWLGWRSSMLGLMMVISIVLLANSLRIIKQDHHKTIVAQPIHESPYATINNARAMAPGAPYDPTLDYTNSVYRFESQTMALNFDSFHNITFIQDQHTRLGNAEVRIGGKINIRRLDAGGYPRMVWEAATNDKGILIDLLVNEEEQALKVSVPRNHNPLNPNIWPCVEMRATIWAPENAEIGVLSLGSIQMHVLFLEDLSLHIGCTRVSTISGDIMSGADHPTAYNNSGLMLSASDFIFIPAKESYMLDSRVTEVATTSGRIGGNWPLYDLLGLHTTSGNITVSITPQEELKADPKTAMLYLSTISGTIYVVEPIQQSEQIPLRDYFVNIKSTSGDISGAFVFGSCFGVESTSSDVTLDLLPMVNAGRVSPNQPTQLETTTTSGATYIRMMEPIWYGNRGLVSNNRPFDCLQAVHMSTNGNLGLRYPQSWEGYVLTDTEDGSLRIAGRDVKIVKSVGTWAGSKLEALKGPARPGSTMHIHAAVGNMNAVIGME
ncbi:hypothetical protein F5Y11DRAFT_168269 [Daldinia sp. FL1419]|nr:hypothetical protein F5Y11DRAFT_168269 [Daldinia sp. FL1419]